MCLIPTILTISHAVPSPHAVPHTSGCRAVFSACVYRVLDLGLGLTGSRAWMSTKHVWGVPSMYGWMRHLALDATPHTPRAVLFMASVVTFFSFF